MVYVRVTPVILVHNAKTGVLAIWKAFCLAFEPGPGTVWPVLYEGWRNRYTIQTVREVKERSHGRIPTQNALATILGGSTHGENDSANL